MKGKPNWEHLSDELHVLITVEDSKNRAEMKLKRAVEEIKKLLVPAVSIFFLNIFIISSFKTL
jgi:protein quaking